MADERNGRSPWDAPVLIGLALLVLVVFRGSLGFAFMSDDPVALRFGEGRSLWSMLTSTEHHWAYYRPVVVLTWRTLHTLLGRYDPFWFHMLPLASHILSAWLLYLLAKRLLGRPAAFLSAALLVFYPFSYQVVPWACAFTSSGVTVLALATVFLYVEARARKSRPLFVGSLFLGLATAFSQEAGVVIGPLVLAVELFAYFQERESGLRFTSLLYFLPSLIYLMARRAALQGRPSRPLELGTFVEKGAVMLQGLVYPVAGVLGPVGRRMGVAPERLVWPTISVCLLVLLLLYWKGRRLSVFLLATSWFLLAILPAWPTLDLEYVKTAARLLYFASPGAVLLWAGLLTLEFDLESTKAAWRLLVVTLLALVMTQGSIFIGKRNVMYRWGTELINQMLEVTQDKGREERLIFLNLPAWVTLWQREYPLFASGVVFRWVELRQEFYIYDGIRRDVMSFALPSPRASWRYMSHLRGRHVVASRVIEAIRADPPTYVYRTEYVDSGLRLDELGSVARDLKPGEKSYLAEFEGLFRLLQAQVEREEGRLRLELEWLCLTSSAIDHTVFAHLYGPNGQLVGQGDGYPLNGLLALNRLAEGDRVQDIRSMKLPEGLPQGSYQVAVGIYDRATMKRLGAISPKGDRVSGDAVMVRTLELPGR